MKSCGADGVWWRNAHRRGGWSRTSPDRLIQKSWCSWSKNGSRVWEKQKTEGSGKMEQRWPKIGWSRVEYGVGMVDNHGAGAKCRAGGQSGNRVGSRLNRLLTARSNLTFHWLHNAYKSIQSIVRRRRLSLFGHVARMPDNVLAKAVLCVATVACNVRDGVPPSPNWRRSRGCPPITWLHQICSDCGLSAGDALNCDQDRAVWSMYAMASSASRWWRR